MDLSGNVWERVISLGSSSGRSFDGNLHGDGVLDASGDANATNWPGTTAAGVGLRGGSWDVASSYTKLSDRYYASTTVATRDATRGGRGARSEPRETDPYWSSVVLLLRGDGADGGTTFTDSSSSAKTVTVNGNSNTSAAYFKTGNAAMSFDGLGDYLTLADSSDWDFGTGDFTIEFWYRTTTVTSAVEILSQRSTTYGPIYVRRNSSKIDLFISTNGTSWLAGAAPIVESPTISINTWYHVAITRRSGTFYLYLDGVPVDSNASYSTTTLPDSTDTFRIGGSSATSGTNGQIDELRITKGVDRYASYFDFSAPTQAFSSSDPSWSSVKLLMNMDAYPLVDSSSSPLSGIYTGTGATTVSPIQSTTVKFGSGAALLAATNSNVVIPADTRFDVGSSDWTWEMWVRAPDGGTFRRVGFLTTPFMRIQTSGSTLTFGLSWNASAYTTLLARALPSTSQFFHYRVTRKGSRYTLHENGTLLAALTNATSNTGSINLIVGGGSGNTNSTDGYVDDVRLSVGVARDAPSSFPLPVKRLPTQ
jgi:hypothetical protein